MYRLTGRIMRRAHAILLAILILLALLQETAK
jgi:hypothetical protein